jgi:hypothetical protein
MMHYSEGEARPRVQVTHKSAFAVPQNSQAAMFTVSGGKVKILSLVGEVTAQMGGGVTNTNVVSNPTVGADVDLCATADVNTDVVGTMYGITGTLADALVAQTSGAFVAQADGVIVAPGTVDYKNDQAAATGSVKWVCTWIAIEDGAEVAEA